MTQLSLDQAIQMGLQHHQAGRLQQAESMYRQILSKDSQHAEAMHLLGVLAGQVGQPQAGIDLINQAIALRQAEPVYPFSRARILAEQGKFDEAIASFRAALQLNPKLADAHCGLGNVLTSTGKFEEALASYRTAIKFTPGHADAHNNMANLLNAQGKYDEAIESYRKALKTNPRMAVALSNLGVALHSKGLLDEALASYKKCLSINIKFPDVHNNLSVVYRALDQLDQAVASARKAIELRPNYADAYSNLSLAMRDVGMLEPAAACARKAHELQPTSPLFHSNLLLTLNYLPGTDAQALYAEARRWEQLHAHPVDDSIPHHDNDRDPERRIRIGYVSRDFREHPVGMNMLPLLRAARHDAFEIVCYSDWAKPDAVTATFRGLADTWRDVFGQSDALIAKQIREDRIDILIDLGVHTDRNHLMLFARKPAPVQVSFAGYPGTTGVATIDYRLTDPHLDPPDQDDSCYAEASLRLPETFWCYDPLTREPAVQPLPALASGTITFGCLNNFCKINEGVVRLWAGVLKRVPDSRMLILAPAGSARIVVTDQFKSEGIDPSRVEFLAKTSRAEYLKYYHRIDIGLDTVPYNGHTTSLDAFWMGVPVITLVGSTVVGRAGLSQLMNLGLPTLIAKSPEDFARIASELAADRPRLAELRSGLRTRMDASPLMDGKRFASHVEALYRDIWRRWCKK